MGADQSKPVIAGDVQLLRVHAGKHEVVTSVPDTYEELDASLRNRLVYIAEGHQLIISARLECYGWQLVEIDPNVYGALKPKLREVWVTARPPLTKESDPPKYAESDQLAHAPIETRANKPGKM
ncbi:hypothetical protein FRB91_001834 [Serendipita sp. 411]|nr:hypothetical protein FRC15_002030 [Serendipita sp. 397]KAG8786180.1 hypothetical protein FRC16_001789 [Serendipita sp. 398]KAG8831976.1 hypothetical protein FRC18_005667 [Serendipita sp. 400]KAG8845392.1 hypothetical protein FRB91_001834 [Serendipita sp. 411]KAG8850554.1 hypothetical protein FRC20_001986 [Serendipita sp. 405]KAG9045624.1 hypothetical protein FS842_001135 [Serendipita sp. 407]